MGRGGGGRGGRVFVKDSHIDTCGVLDVPSCDDEASVKNNIG